MVYDACFPQSLPRDVEINEQILCVITMNCRHSTIVDVDIYGEDPRKLRCNTKVINLKDSDTRHHQVTECLKCLLKDNDEGISRHCRECEVIGLKFTTV